MRSPDATTLTFTVTGDDHADLQARVDAYVTAYLGHAPDADGRRRRVTRSLDVTPLPACAGFRADVIVTITPEPTF